jgi:type II secretion system protein N
MKRLRTWFFYIAYTVSAVGLFLYLLFPGESVKGAVSAYLVKTFPAYQIQIGQVAPILPFGLGLDSVRISQQDRLNTQIDEIKLTPKVVTLFSNSKTVYFQGRAYSGVLDGNIDLNQRDTGLHTEMVLKLSDIRVDEIEYLQSAIERKLSGILNGIVTIVDEPGSRDSLKGNLELRSTRLAFSNPLIKVSEINFNTVSADFNLNKKVFSLKRLEATGGQVTGNLAGTMMLRKPFENSRLNLRGSFIPEEALLAGMQGIISKKILNRLKPGAKGMPVRIYGTLAKPRFSFR